MGRFERCLRTTLARAVLVIVTLGAMVVSSAGVAASSTPVAKPRQGGVLKIGIPVEIASLDPARGSPYAGQTTGGVDRLTLVYGRLLTLNSKTLEVQPGLALSLVPSGNDGVTWTLKLRPNLKFSDGTPLDANAVIFNVDRMRKPATGYTGLAQVAQITTMTAVNSTTVEFKLAASNGSFPLVFADIPGMMVSPTAMQANPNTWAQNPVGAGPFVLKSWTRDSSYVFVRNPTYYAAPLPYLDEINVMVRPTFSTAANELKSGQLDGFSSLGNADFGAVQNDPNLVVTDLAKRVGLVALVANQTSAPGNDPIFREALSYSIDFERSVATLLPGLDWPVKKLVCPPFLPGNPNCDSAVSTSYKPAKAKRLFDQVRAKGVNPDFTYTTNTATRGELVQQMLATVGVKVTVNVVSTAQYQTSRNSGNFQVTDAAFPATALQGPLYYSALHSNTGGIPGIGYQQLKIAPLDVALEKMSNAATPEGRSDGAKAAQKIVADQHILTWLAPLPVGYVMSKSVQLPRGTDVNSWVLNWAEMSLKKS